MQGQFNTVALHGYEAGDTALFKKAALPQDEFIRTMFLMGLAHVRDDVRRSVFKESFE